MKNILNLQNKTKLKDDVFMENLLNSRIDKLESEFESSLNFHFSDKRDVVISSFKTYSLKEYVDYLKELYDDINMRFTDMSAVEASKDYIYNKLPYFYQNIDVDDEGKVLRARAYFYENGVEKAFDKLDESSKIKVEATLELQWWVLNTVSNIFKQRISFPIGWEGSSQGLIEIVIILYEKNINGIRDKYEDIFSFAEVFCREFALRVPGNIKERINRAKFSDSFKRVRQELDNKFITEVEEKDVESNNVLFKTLVSILGIKDNFKDN